MEHTIDPTHQVKKKPESVDLVKDAKDLQKNEEEKDTEFLWWGGGAVLKEARDQPDGHYQSDGQYRHQ